MIFEVGLVLSGTVSAGPYTAGVIDYLIEALDAWYEAKRAGGSDIPRMMFSCEWSPAHQVVP